MNDKSPPLVVINVVGLTPDLLGKNTPELNRLIDDGFMATLDGVFPAVTCSAQASMLTGLLPTGHGIVGNGWYFRELGEILFWRQPNWLVQGEKVWQAARKARPDFSCAQLFWWFNMYADIEWSVTPRPIYPADGRKIPSLYSEPADLSDALEQKLGPFPFFDFWGPRSGIRSSQWIAAAARELFDEHRPDLTLVYLPHLDYNLQRLGPNDPATGQDVRAIDRVAGTLVDHSRAAGAEVLILSEYGLEQATGVVHINRVLRQQGMVRVRETLGWELLDPGASRAFAVADHQVAQVHVRDPHDLGKVRKLLERTPGIEQVLGETEKPYWGIAHPRAGELITVAAPGHWFSYYYWADDARAPDFARTVDIHRKPGYDPVELFLDPDLTLPQVKVAWRLLQKKLGFRALLDVIPLDAGLVRGTHGRLAATPEQGPLVIGSHKSLARDRLPMREVKGLILQHLN